MSNYYTAATLPSGRDPTASQLADMNTNWQATKVTKASVPGTVGMFGYEVSDADTCPWGEDGSEICSYDEYYFYMKFVPYDDITATADAVFRILFQIGNDLSDWSGVEYINTSASLTLDTDLTPVSVSNQNIASRLYYDDDSYFRGKIFVENGKYEVVIWRYIPRWEQDETDGSIDRIEKGRLLKGQYDDFNKDEDPTPFEITLESAVLSRVASVGLILATATALAF